MEVVRAGTCLGLNANKSSRHSFTRRLHLVLRDLALDVPMSGVGRPLGFVLRPDSSAIRWAVVRVKFLARAAHRKARRLRSLGIPMAYNTFAMAVVTDTAQLVPPNANAGGGAHRDCKGFQSTDVRVVAEHQH